MALEWRDQMSVGYEPIDNDHKNLLNLIAEYEKTIQLKSVKRLNIVFRELVRYSEEHFKREEDILFKERYPLANEHSEHHKELVKQLNAFHEDLTEHKKFDLKKTTAFFKSWLLDHVLKEDLQFKTYVEGLSQKNPKL